MEDHLIAVCHLFSSKTQLVSQPVWAEASFQRGGVLAQHRYGDIWLMLDVISIKVAMGFWHF